MIGVAANCGDARAVSAREHTAADTAVGAGRLYFRHGTFEAANRLRKLNVNIPVFQLHGKALGAANIGRNGLAAFKLD